MHFFIFFPFSTEKDLILKDLLGLILDILAGFWVLENGNALHVSVFLVMCRGQSKIG